MNNPFPASNEYVGKYDWREAKERIPNDYGAPELPYTCERATGKEVWEDDKYMDSLTDLIF